MGNFSWAEVFTKKKPKDGLKFDIGYAYSVFCHLKEFGVGRAIVVKNATVMAVEAAEGLFETVKRGCAMGRKDAFVVINDETKSIKLCNGILELIANCKGNGLGFAKDAVCFENFDEFIKRANELGLIILAFDGDKFYNNEIL